MEYAIIFLFLYFVPTGLASKSRRGGVFVINLFFGWSLIGWAVALYMAVRSREVG